jgi:hypothetical protein
MTLLLLEVSKKVYFAVHQTFPHRTLQEIKHYIQVLFVSVNYLIPNKFSQERTVFLKFTRSQTKSL